MLTVNSYFDDKVKSIGFSGETLPATVGVISAGEYTFGTSKYETITIISGELTVQLPGSTQWTAFSSGDSFEVAANAVFTAKSQSDTAYLCTYA